MSELRFPGYRLLWLLALASIAFGPARAGRAEEISAIVLSSDTALALAGVVVDDETPAREAVAGGVALLPLGALPANADLEALAATDGGDWLLALYTATELSGGLIAEPNDVVRYDGVSFLLELDGATVGLPAGSAVDSLAWLPSGALLLSFDTTVRLGSTVFDDADLAELAGGVFTMFFDGSAGGISSSLDLDAAAYTPSEDRLYLSFDGSGTAPSGLVFDDEDVLVLERSSGTWSLAYDGSAGHSQWPAADLDALEVQLLGSALFADGFESGDTSAWSLTVP